MEASPARLPEARGARPLQENLRQTKIAGHREKKSQVQEDPRGSHPHHRYVPEKERKMGTHLVEWKLTDIGAHLLKAPESQSLSQGKMSLLGYTFCINLASVEILTRV